MNKKYLKIIFAILLIGIGLWLRLRYINGALWYDEACSWFSAKYSGGILNNLLNFDLQHTPIYFVLLKVWMKFFGEGETALRFLSLIFGFGSIFLTYITAKKITGEMQASFAAAIAALSPLTVIFSVEVRMYPVVIFLVLLSLNYLIDFEQKSDKKSLVKLIITNILIPYTFVGGIFYNFSILCVYGYYLFKNNKNKFNSYKIGVIFEWICLIPYFCLIFYYAKVRSIFVVAHESIMRFYQIFDVIRNFFGVSIDTNIYWPSDGVYNLTFWYTLFVLVPCVYFVAALFKGYKRSVAFLRVLYGIFFLTFVLSVIISMLKVNVFTVRYIIYLLMPFVILGIAGMFSFLSDRHCKVFLVSVIAGMGIFSYFHAENFLKYKEMAFKSVRIEADKLGLTSDDIVLMPFGSDAPYYFRNLTSARVINLDFHKTVRNPYNDAYYDKYMQDKMAGNTKYHMIGEAIAKDRVISESFYNYFVSNVNMSVSKGRFVLVALYSSDAKALVDIKTLRSQITGPDYIKEQFLDVMFKKYMCDILSMLNQDFNFIKMYNSDSYTYLLFQRM